MIEKRTLLAKPTKINLRTMKFQECTWGWEEIRMDQQEQEKRSLLKLWVICSGDRFLSSTVMRALM